MKKLLITGYFVVTLLLTFLVAKAVGTYKNGNVEIKYRKLSQDISDVEMEDYNRRGVFEKQMEHKEGFEFVRYDEVKETRTKKMFGWETKVDTIKSYILQEECGCK
jgi:hypothetical protein